MRKDVRHIAQVTVETCRLQWEQRKAFQCIQARLPDLAVENGLKGIPNNWCELVNTMVRPCPYCKKAGVVTSRWHLWVKHRIRLPHVNYIWRREILPISLGVSQRLGPNDPRGERQVIRDTAKPIIQRHLTDYYNAWSKLLASS